MCSERELVLSSIDEIDGTLTWHVVALPDYSENANEPKIEFEPKMFHISNKAQYWIDYPIMCHLDHDHVNRHLVITNLAIDPEDQSQARSRTFVFDDVRFIAFLGLNRIQAESRIAFLGKNIKYGQLCVTLLRHDMSLESSRRVPDLHKWSIQTFNLSPFKGLKTHLNELQ